MKQTQDDDLVLEEALDSPAEARKIKPLKRLKKVNIDRILAEMRGPLVIFYIDSSAVLGVLGGQKQSWKDWGRWGFDCPEPMAV